MICLLKPWPEQPESLAWGPIRGHVEYKRARIVPIGACVLSVNGETIGECTNITITNCEFRGGRTSALNFLEPIEFTISYVNSAIDPDLEDIDDDSYEYDSELEDENDSCFEDSDTEDDEED